MKSEITGKDILEARIKLGLTQKEFAQLYGLSHKTIEHWEQTGVVPKPVNQSYALESFLRRMKNKC